MHPFPLKPLVVGTEPKHWYKGFLSSFFTQSSCLAVFHDRFSDLEQELQQTLKLKVGAPLLISYITLTPLWGLNCIGYDARLNLCTWPLWRWGILRLRQELPRPAALPAEIRLLLLSMWNSRSCFPANFQTEACFKLLKVLCGNIRDVFSIETFIQCFGQSSGESFFLLPE